VPSADPATAAPGARPRLPRAVPLFGGVSLLNDFASEMIYPLLPAFVTTVLGGGAQALGALDGAAEFAAALVKVVAGRLADRRARRGRLVVAGYGVAVLVRPIIALTAAAWQVIGLRVMDRIGKGLRTPPRDALIGDVTPLGLRGRAFGLQRGMDHAGAVLGPVVAWWLLTSGAAELRRVIAASILPGLLALALAVWAVREGGKKAGEADRDPEQSPAPAAPPSLARPPGAVVAISFFYLLRMPDTLIILRSQQLGVAVAVVPLLWAAVHVVRSSVSLVGGAWSDRFGPGRTMRLGWLCYAGLAAALGFASSALQAWALFLALGVVAGLTESPERALVARLAGPRQGSGFGVFHGMTGLAALLGGVALGWGYERYGARPAFVVSAICGLALVLARSRAGVGDGGAWGGSPA
jgi:MFS family permease